MKCSHPDCTGVHDNNRYHELCPRSLDGKRDRDLRYHASVKGIIKRIRVHAAGWPRAVARHAERLRLRTPAAAPVADTLTLTPCSLPGLMPAQPATAAAPAWPPCLTSHTTTWLSRSATIGYVLAVGNQSTLPRTDPLGLSIDHEIPISQGGPDTAANVTAMHLHCNLAKSARDLIAYWFAA